MWGSYLAFSANRTNHSNDQHKYMEVVLTLEQAKSSTWTRLQSFLSIIIAHTAAGIFFGSAVSQLSVYSCLCPSLMSEALILFFCLSGECRGLACSLTSVTTENHTVCGSCQYPGENGSTMGALHISTGYPRKEHPDTQPKKAGRRRDWQGAAFWSRQPCTANPWNYRTWYGPRGYQGILKPQTLQRVAISISRTALWMCHTSQNSLKEETWKILLLWF